MADGSRIVYAHRQHWTRESMSDVTLLLQRIRKGDREAIDELMPLVYGELRRIARAFELIRARCR